MKTLEIQNVILTERPPSVRWYSEAKTLLNLLKDYIARETEPEFNEVLQHSNAFEKLTGGVTLDELIKCAEDPEQLEAINEKIKNNFTEPEGLKVLTSILNYSDKVRTVKETFVAGESVIKNAHGIETMTSNLKLILKTQYEGDLAKINFNTTDIDEILALIASGSEALEDFFYTCLQLKDALRISPSVMRIIQLKENLTFPT